MIMYDSARIHVTKGFFSDNFLCFQRQHDDDG